MFKEISKSVELERGLIIPKIKGHTKIELTDIRTKKKETVEHDNVFQSGIIANYMRSLGIFNNNPYANGTWAARSILQNLVGGIFLFKDTITEGTEYMPAGNKMIGNASMGISNSSTPTELGSYNDIESSITANSATLVFDWNTTQGNGEIGCVCLTSDTGGLIGYGNASGSVYSSPIQLTRNQNSNNIGNYTVCGNYGYNFAINNSTRTLTIYKTKLPITKESIFSKTTETITKTFEHSQFSAEAIETRYIGNNKILIFGTRGRDWGFYNYIDNNATGYILIYDCSNDTLTEGKITNTTGSALYLASATGGSGTTYADNFAVNGNFAYFTRVSSSVGTSTSVYKFNITTGALVETITLNYPAATIADQYHMPTHFTPILPDIWAYRGQNNILVLHDTVNETEYPCNASAIINSNNNVGSPVYNDSIDAIVSKGQGLATMTYSSYNASAAFAFKNPLYLATINNLDSPVTKTAAKTMKITYTLTPAT